ncbi:MAG: hypothetical protein ACOVO3_00885 [Fluviicola sp.]
MRILSFVAALLTAGMSFAQMTEGKITYSMEFTSDNPDMAMYTSMMQGSKMELSFMPGKSKAAISMGAMGTMVTTTDEKADKSLMLMDMMGQKMAMTGTLSEQEKDPEAAAAMPKFTFEITNETKVIAGYTCFKAIATLEDGTQTEMWFTKDISANTKGQQYFNKDMPGFPMEYSVNQQGMVIKMTVTDISKTVDKKAFDMKIPDGYTVKTMDELKSMGGE